MKSSGKNPHKPSTITDLVDYAQDQPTLSILPNCRIQIRPSYLNKSYQPYNPVYSKILNNSKKYTPLNCPTHKSKEGIPLSVCPRILQ